MKYAFIQRHRRVWPISVQCRVLQVSVAGYHEHFVRRASRVCEDRQRRHLSDDALLMHIKAIHAETHGGYGWPRTWKELLARGIHVGKQRVHPSSTPNTSFAPNFGGKLNEINHLALATETCVVANPWPIGAGKVPVLRYTRHHVPQAHQVRRPHLPAVGGVLPQ